jgi:hypothetical protein
MVCRARMATAGASALVGCRVYEARHLLKAAGVSFTRSGRCGQVLWQAEDVDMLIENLPSKRKGGQGNG